jgi:hypothetical protein
MTAADLAALARAATPGPWVTAEGNFIVADNDLIVAEVPCAGGNDADVPHIAAWSPELVLGALAVIEAARGTASPNSARALDAALAAWDAINTETKP